MLLKLVAEGCFSAIAASFNLCFYIYADDVNMHGNFRVIL